MTIKKAKLISVKEGPAVFFKKAGNFLTTTALSSFYVINKARKTEGLPQLTNMSPSRIEWLSTLPYHNFPHIDNYMSNSVIFSRPIVGVAGGPWDKHKIKWSDSILYKSMSKHFIEGLPWSQTEIYRQARARIDKGMDWGSITTMEELEAKCEQRDSLFESMKENGFLAQRSGDIRISGELFPDECRVGIGRNGEVIRLSGGHHRISIAKLLGIEQVPVIIVVRHRRRRTKENQNKESAVH